MLIFCCSFYLNLWFVIIAAQAQPMTGESWKLKHLTTIPGVSRFDVSVNIIDDNVTRFLSHILLGLKNSSKNHLMLHHLSQLMLLSFSTLVHLILYLAIYLMCPNLPENPTCKSSLNTRTFRHRFPKMDNFHLISTQLEPTWINDSGN